jgi:hypothetical protein
MYCYKLCRYKETGLLLFYWLFLVSGFDKDGGYSRKSVPCLCVPRHACDDPAILLFTWPTSAQLLCSLLLWLEYEVSSQKTYVVKAWLPIDRLLGSDWFTRTLPS